MKNNEVHNAKQREARVKRATRLLRRYQRGATVAEIAEQMGITKARVYKLIASVK